MKFQQLIIALEIYKSGSISKAAQNLYMSQPNLSAALKDLENELGMKVFKRTAKGTEPTKSGEEFILLAIDVISRFKRLEQSWCSPKQGISSLSVTTMRSSSISMRMVNLLNKIIDAGLQVRFRIKETTNFKVIEDVVSGEADLGIIRPNSTNVGYFYQIATSKQCALIPLPSIPYRVLMSENHPLAKEEKVSFETLKPYVEVAHGDFGTPMYPYSEFDADSENRNIVYVYDRGTLMDMLSEAHGAYMWTTNTDARLLELFHLVEKKSDADPVEGKDTIIYKSAKPMTQEMQQFISLFDVNILPS
jgi:DNA-binding transcriptional LysR family regulator